MASQASFGTQSLVMTLAVALALSMTACGRTQKSTTAPGSAPPSGEDAGATGSAALPSSSPTLMFKSARIMTAAGVIHERADVLVAGDRIVAVGPDLTPPEGVRVVEAGGKVITPGIIDTHSHIGVYASPEFEAHSDGNEIVGPNTAYVRAADGYWPQDPQIDAARAGGITTMQILPGSANLIGGRSVVVKTYPEQRSVEDARFPGAPEGLKMACGENPKRVYGEKGGPHTRMGNIAGFRAAFQQAVEYRDEWIRYWEDVEQHRRDHANDGDDDDDDGDNNDNDGGNDKDDDHDDRRDSPPEPPERDFALETLAKAMDGEILVHNHCYRADEMSLMMELAETYGFRIRSFHHAVEAYKIADRLREHGAAASVWADWWGFKAEAYDGIRENAAMLAHSGARAIIHSDSALGIQRLNQEAAKAMYAGRRAGIDISEDEALRWITANPAWALGISDQVGTIEAGKQADLVVWSGTPFSVYTHVDQVYIEGRLVYDRADPQHQPRTDFGLGHDGKDYSDHAGAKP